MTTQTFRLSAPPIRSSAIAIAGWAGSLLLFLPIALMVLKSFQTEQVAASPSPVLVFEPTLANYQAAFDAGFWQYFMNSVYVVALSTFVVLVVAVPAAWALAIRPIPKSKDVLFFFISTKMLPIAAGIIPIYVLVSELGKLNDLNVLVIMMIGLNIPLAVWMLRSFMLDIPREIMEAAEVDGASRWKVMRTVVVPLMRPGLIATALLAAVFAWNEFFYAVNLTSSNTVLPMFMQKFLAFGELYTAQVAAVATLASLPVIIAGWLAQNSLVRGLTFGAIK